jgi:hypothetical protein
LIIVLVFLCAALGLCLTLLLRLHRRLDGLPARVWDIAKQERARDEGRALTALTEATAVKVGSSTAALRVYEEELAATARRQIAEAEKLARLAVRRVAEVSPMMETAGQLVRELRDTLDALRAAPRCTASGPAESAPPEPDPDTRATVEMPPPVTYAPPRDGEEEDSDELTTVTTRAAVVAAAAPETTPMPGRAVASRERVSPLALAFAPPGSAETPPPEPAQRAAGLTRPAGSTRPPVTPPTTPPPSAGPARRRATILGIPPPSGVHRSAPTLVSMTAVTAPEAARGAEGEGHKPGGGR